jgi:hypothetical protein
MKRCYHNPWCECDEPMVRDIEINKKRLELILSMRLLRSKHLIHANVINKSVPTDELSKKRCIAFGYRSFMLVVSNNLEPIDIAMFKLCQCCHLSAIELMIDNEIKDRLVEKIL